MTNLRSLGNRCCTTLLIVCLSLLPGCATDPVKKKSDDDPPQKKAIEVDPLAKQARELRANSADEAGTGLSDKSRSIENDLGLR